MTSHRNQLLSKFWTGHLMLAGVVLIVGNHVHASADWVVRANSCSAIVADENGIAKSGALASAEVFPETDHLAVLPERLQQDLRESRTRLRDFVLTAEVLFFSVSKKSEEERDQKELPKLDLFGAFSGTLGRQKEISDSAEKILFGHDIAGDRYGSWEKQHRGLIEEMRYGHRESLRGLTEQPIHSERRERIASRDAIRIGQEGSKSMSAGSAQTSEKTGDDLIRVEDRISRAIGSLRKERDATKALYDSLSEFAEQIGHMKEWQKREVEKLKSEVNNSNEMSENQKSRITMYLKNANEDAQFLLRSLYDPGDSKSWIKILFAQSQEHLQSLDGWINELQTELSHSPGAGTL